MTTHAQIDALTQRARGSGPAALSALGKRLLVGDGVPASPEGGVAALREALRLGDASAGVLLSVCAARGVAQEPNFSVALDYLENAAKLGSRDAQRELQLLARSAAADENWSSLRQRVQTAAWAMSPEGRLVRDRPRIVVIQGFMSPAECAWVIAKGRPRLARAKVYRQSATAQAVESRTNSDASFTIFNSDVVLELLRERMSQATRAPASHLELAKLLHYEPGQQFALHADFIHATTPELVREVQVRGQRAATLLVYLNEGYEGGETDFPRLQFRFKGRCGDALVFSNIDPAGAPDYDTVHAGLPPTSGEKWVLSQWIRTRRIEP